MSVHVVSGAVLRAAGKPIPRGDGKGYKAAYYDKLGRRRWASGQTAEEAEKRRDNALLRLQDAKNAVSDTTTVLDVLEEWLDKVPPGTRTKTARKGKKHSSYERDKGNVRNHLGRFLMDVPVRRLDTEHVDEMIAALEAEEYLSNRSIELVCTTLTTGLAWAVQKALIPQSVLDEVRRATLPPVDRAREVPAFSVKLTTSLLAAFLCHRLRSLFEVAASVGPRQGELLAARWDDIDWEAKLLRVRWTLVWRKGGMSVRERNKRSQVRSVPLSTRTIEALREWRERQAGERQRMIDAGGIWPNDSADADFVWTSQNGTPLRGTGNGGVTNQLKRLLKRSGFADWNDWNFYVLRHHAASWILAANNGNLFEVMRILGHSSYRQIQDTYGHLVDEAVQGTMTAAAHLIQAVEASLD